MFITEYEKYKDFIRENFPNNNIIESSKLPNVHKIIYQNLLFIDFVSKNETSKNSQRDVFFQDFLNINLRILYHLPLKDIYLNRVLSRILSECTAKILLSYFSDVSDIQTLTMKKIKEELRKKGIHKRYKLLYEFISGNFGTLSADVHGRELSRKYNNAYLSEMLNDKHDSFMIQLENFHKGINEYLLPCLLETITYDKSTANEAKILAILEEI